MQGMGQGDLCQTGAERLQTQIHDLKYTYRWETIKTYVAFFQNRWI